MTVYVCKIQHAILKYFDYHFNGFWLKLSLPSEMINLIKNDNDFVIDLTNIKGNGKYNRMVEPGIVVPS